MGRENALRSIVEKKGFGYKFPDNQDVFFFCYEDESGAMSWSECGKEEFTRMQFEIWGEKND